MKDKIKQVIVIRRNYYDEKGNKFGMRLGKTIAQACHASNGAAFLARMVGTFDDGTLCSPASGMLVFRVPEVEKEWYFEKFTKATVQVKEEAELLEIYYRAKEAKLPCFLICDEGVTEFKGRPTHTCCAIGPAPAEEIDKITGHLELL